MWVGIWKLLLGKKRHVNWHWTDESRKRPTPMALFIARSENPEWFEVLGWRLEQSPLRPFMRLIALGYEFEAWSELPQTLRGVLLFVPRLVIALGRLILRRLAPEEEEEKREEEEGSEENAETAGRHERLRKRLCAAAGLFGIYLMWTIFSWCACTGLRWHALHRNAADRHCFVHDASQVHLHLCVTCKHARASCACILTPQPTHSVRWHAHLQPARLRCGVPFCAAVGRGLCHG
jgi:hypothetical protein